MSGSFIVEKSKVLVDQETGEVYDGTLYLNSSAGYRPYLKITKEDLKLWISCTDTPQDKVKAYLIGLIKADNTICKTMDEIAQGAGVGINTASRTMNKMAEKNLLKRIGHGRWMVNPDFYCTCKKGVLYKLRKVYDSIDAASKKEAEINE